MLKKLLKYDLRAMFKYFIPMTIFVFAYSLLGTLFFHIEDIGKYNAAIPRLLIVGTIIGFVLILIAYSIITQGIIVVDFFKTMVTDRGYLTHTLPVKKSSILISKYIAGTILQVISLIVMAISLMTFLDIPRLLITNSHLIGEVFKELFTNISTSTIVLSVISFIICCFASIFFSLATYFLAIAIGQRMNHHKIVGSIVAYGVLSIVIQIFSSICGFSLQLSSEIATAETFSLLSLPLFLAGMSVVLVILAFVMTIIIYEFFNKKLNLD